MIHACSSMARVHTRTLSSSASLPFTSKRETFTIWMKSLVLNGKGCTVYDSNGQIMYRVDNYNRRYRDEVYLMDLEGNILFKLFRKKSKFSTCWEGYRFIALENNQKKPSFQVKKTCRIPRGVSFYEVSFGLDEDEPCSYKIESCIKETGCKIVDQLGQLVAKLTRKKSSCGVDLGDDVLQMVVEPNIDLSLLMGLVVAYGLINSKM